MPRNATSRPDPWPAVLALCTAVLGGCLALGPDVDVDSDVPYDVRFGDATVMDVVRPKGGTAVARPAVLVIHGGGWNAGSKGDLSQDARQLAGAGYVAININYRLVPDGAFPRDVQDCLCALAYVRAHADQYGIDPARIAALGYSAGGHLASMLGVAAREPSIAPDCAAGTTGPPVAVISGAGPEDFHTMPQVGTIFDYLGGTIDQVPEIYDRASPITYVAATAPPFLFVQGEDDRIVSEPQSRVMRDALDAVGVETRLLEIPGGGHVWNRGSDGDRWELPIVSIDTPESQAAIVDFLDHTIGPTP